MLTKMQGVCVRLQYFAQAELNSQHRIWLSTSEENFVRLKKKSILKKKEPTDGSLFFSAKFSQTKSPNTLILIC